MPEEHEILGSRSSASPEIYQQPKFMSWFEKAFPWLLVSGAALGLTLMIILPIIFFQEKTGDQLKAQSDLRLALLYTTGGAIAALGLLETYRKNTNDRAKANADIKAALKNQEHQAEVLKEQIRQFDENAFKERKAERRERYTEAVEQLGRKETPVRIGGVYTLVGLVDEWLEEKNLEYSERLKEGQVIINNLCAYIRSPFTLASHYDELSIPSPTPKGIYKGKKEKFYADKATLDSEADVRLSIIKEIHDRLQGPEISTPGAWSNFEYDFSGSIFFYPVDLTKSHYTKPVNFSGSTYWGEANFTGSTYKDWADFSESTYKKDVIFSTSDSHSTYWGEANFTGSTYKGQANFSGSTYKKDVIFSTPNSIFSTSDSHSTYWGEANFTGSTYKGQANFSESTYKKDVIFSTSDSHSTYWGEANFTGSTYHRADFSGSAYEGKADFSRSTYWGEATFMSSTYQRADFSGSAYEGKADFSRSTYWGEATFMSSTYQGKADFRDSTYREGVYFSSSTYQNEVYFSGSIYQDGATFISSNYQSRADFSDSTYEGKAEFIGSTYQDKARFSDSTYRGRAGFGNSIYLEEADLRRSTYQDEADFSGSVFYREIYFGYSTYSPSFSRFTGCAPQFYDETNRKNTLFGSSDNDFSVENGRGYPVYRGPEGLPFGCKFLTSEQKEYLADKFQEIDETKNKLLEIKDDEEKAKLLDTPGSLKKELHDWCKEITTVKVEGTALGEEDK